MTEAMTGLDLPPAGVVPGLLLAGVDAGVGWFLYDAVAPALGFALWAVAAFVVAGLLLDGLGRIPRHAEPSSGALARE
jgi:hypothetical protein